MQPGSVEWMVSLLEARGGQLPFADLSEALERALGGPAETVMATALSELKARLRLSPMFTRLSSGEVALTRARLQGANLRYTPSAWEIDHGVLNLEGTEIALICATIDAMPDLEVSWRDLSEIEPQRVRLARLENEWVMPGLGAWYQTTGFQPGDDLLVHVRYVAAPLFVFDRQSRLERDEASIQRRSMRALDAAHAALRAETLPAQAGLARLHGDGWLPVERVVRMLVGQIDFRKSVAPDAFGPRLLATDPRFLRAPDGRTVRLAHFHDEASSRAFLAGLRSPAEALGAFFEEYPPRSAEDRARALAHIEALWHLTPRAELGGRSPAEVEAHDAKIVPFDAAKRSPNR